MSGNELVPFIVYARNFLVIDKKRGMPFTDVRFWLIL